MRLLLSLLLLATWARAVDVSTSVTTSAKPNQNIETFGAVLLGNDGKGNLKPIDTKTGGGISLSGNSAEAYFYVNNSPVSGTNPLPVSPVSTIGVSAAIASVAAGVSITVNNTNASAVPVRLTGVSEISASALGVTLNAITANLKTSGTVDGLNIANAFDYDANTKTGLGAVSRKLNETVNYYYATSGTTSITTSGYQLVYSVTVYPSSVAGSNLKLFDGTVTRTAIALTTAGIYSYPRGIAFKTNCVAVVTGSSFDGGVSIECDR